jgi:hypothetical protein
MFEQALRRWDQESPPPEEVERFHRALAGQEGHIEAIAWLELLVALDDYRKEGEPALFRSLTPLIVTNYDFVMRRWWVQDIFAELYNGGKEKEFIKLLFGQGKIGVQRLSVRMRDYKRNKQIFYAMGKLLYEKNGTLRKAAIEVSARWEEFSLPEKLSYQSIMRIYKNALTSKSFWRPPSA